MKLAILHDQNGITLATSRIVDLKEAGSKFLNAGMVPRQGQHLLEIDISEIPENVPNQELHNDYQIDVQKSKLVKRKKP